MSYFKAIGTPPWRVSNWLHTGASSPCVCRGFRRLIWRWYLRWRLLNSSPLLKATRFVDLVCLDVWFALAVRNSSFCCARKVALCITTLHPLVIILSRARWVGLMGLCVRCQSSAFIEDACLGSRGAAPCESIEITRLRSDCSSKIDNIYRYSWNSAPVVSSARNS